MADLANIDFPEDAALVVALFRRFVTWVAAEKARTGLDDAGVAAKYGFKFDSNDDNMDKFLNTIADETGAG